MRRDNQDLSMGFWTVGEKYWNVVDLLCEGIVRNQNRNFVMSGVELRTEEILERTKWSDGNLTVPLLFNFYHGAELMLKGFVLRDATLDRPPGHRLSTLLGSFATQYPDESGLVSLLQRYLVVDEMPEVLQGFFRENGTTPDKFYDCLKYPFSKDLTVRFEHYGLVYKASRGIAFYRQLRDDIGAMMPIIVQLGRTLCREGADRDRDSPRGEPLPHHGMYGSH